MQQQGRYGTFICLNCGRKQPKDKPNQKFCKKADGGNCHDKFWNKGNRKLAQLLKGLGEFERKLKALASACEVLGERVEHLEKLAYGSLDDD